MPHRGFPFSHRRCNGPSCLSNPWHLLQSAGAMVRLQSRRCPSLPGLLHVRGLLRPLSRCRRLQWWLLLPPSGQCLHRPPELAPPLSSYWLPLPGPFLVLHPPLLAWLGRDSRLPLRFLPPVSPAPHLVPRLPPYRR